MTGRTIFEHALAVVFLSLCFTVAGCSKPTVPMPVELPTPKQTVFNRALIDLGKMTEIYGTYTIRIQNIALGDETGLSRAHKTEGEIPQRITEMITSTLNAIGGKVVFVPFLPNYLNSMQTVGYPDFSRKLVPNVILSGGITEFDRGLETRGKNTDIDFETEPISDAPSWFNNDTIRADFSSAIKSSMATITLDFNLIDYQTFSGIPGMQAVNTIRVYKTNRKRELGFSLFGPSFGLRGSIQKVQGRHAAVRLLVQLNTIQIIGKLYDLPYWNLLPGSVADPVVLDELRADFHSWPPMTRTIKVQEMLFLNGYDILITGELDQPTRIALHNYNPGFDTLAGSLNAELFLQLYQSVPITNTSLERRRLFDRRLKRLKESFHNDNPDQPHSKTKQSS